jgi:hypothetical protein
MPFIDPRSFCCAKTSLLFGNTAIRGGKQGAMSRFLQSTNDFPCPVMLGKNAPSFGLHRFKQGLRFVPPDDEGFIFRGDKQRLIYKGRRRSHRFTILGDTAFEYDCILLKEPDSNTVTLRMEGAENFDFFRQPDFVPDKFLKGSYAVYKKETLVGEGTGKLCHIHRPEIIDARGRRCWGELAVVGNELRITIPERFLSVAKYPVVVDPTIGTTTVGNLYYPVTKPDNGSFLVYEIGVNKFLASEEITGQCTAWAYFSEVIENNDYSYNPRVFDDNNNSPTIRRSCNEGNAEWRLWYDENNWLLPVENTPKWKSATFNIIGKISQGSYIWFGGYGDVFPMRFDYGGLLYKTYQEYIFEDEDDEEGIEYPDFPYFGYEQTYDRKVSWYFEYISQSSNYIRTITQGVTITDNKVLSAGYKRKTEQTVKTETTTNKLQNVYRRIQEAVKCNEYLLFPVSIVRRVCDAVKVFDTLKRLRIIFIGLLENVNAYGKAKSGYILLVKITDTVRAAGGVLRSLFLFVRIISNVFITDFLLKRFLVSKTEVKLKSCVTREIILESRIN